MSGISEGSVNIFEEGAKKSFTSFAVLMPLLIRILAESSVIPDCLAIALNALGSVSRTFQFFPDSR